MPDGVSTFARLEEKTLGDDGAKRRQIDDVRVFQAVAETAAGGDEGVLEAKRAYL
jgi:hypothetical protein